MCFELLGYALEPDRDGSGLIAKHYSIDDQRCSDASAYLLINIRTIVLDGFYKGL